MAAQFAEQTQALIAKLTAKGGGVENEDVLALLEAAADMNEGFTTKAPVDKMRIMVLDAKVATKFIENRIG